MQVVQAIGASDTGLLDFSAPKKIDGAAAISLVEAADELGVQQYVMVTSMGTGKWGWPAGKCSCCQQSEPVWPHCPLSSSGH